MEIRIRQSKLDSIDELSINNEDLLFANDLNRFNKTKDFHVFIEPYFHTNWKGKNPDNGDWFYKIVLDKYSSEYNVITDIFRSYGYSWCEIGKDMA